MSNINSAVCDFFSIQKHIQFDNTLHTAYSYKRLAVASNELMTMTNSAVCIFLNVCNNFYLKKNISYCKMYAYLHFLRIINQNLISIQWVYVEHQFCGMRFLFKSMLSKCRLPVCSVCVYMQSTWWYAEYVPLCGVCGGMVSMRSVCRCAEYVLVCSRVFACMYSLLSMCYYAEYALVRRVCAGMLSMQSMCWVCRVCVGMLSMY